MSRSSTPSPGINQEPDQAKDLAAFAAVGLLPRFPDQSNKTSVVLYGNALGTLSAHWRLMPNDKERAGASFPPGGAHPLPVLRLIHMRPSGDCDPVAEVALIGEARAGAGDCTFPVHPDQGRYCAELGLSTGEGAWLMLARSNEFDQISRPVPEPGNLDTETSNMPGPPAVQALRPLPEFSAPEDQEPALAMRFPGPTVRVFPLAAPPVASQLTSDQKQAPGPGMHGDALPGSHPGPESRQDFLECRSVRLRAYGEPVASPVQPVLTAPTTTDAIQITPITRLTYGQPPGGVGGIQVEAELRITGQAPPGSLIDLYGYPYRIGAGGRFQLVLRVDDPTLLRRALELHPPPELILTRDL